VRLRRALVLLVGAFTLALVFASVPHGLQVAAGVALVLLIPGYALGRAMVGVKGPVGETAVLSIAVSVSVAGLGGLLLALFHEFGRLQFIALLSLISVGATAVTMRRSGVRAALPAVGLLTRRAIALTAVAAVITIAILIVAFQRDVASARVQQRDSSVALAAVRDKASLKVEVIAGLASPFSGSASLRSASSIVASWTIRELRPGESWTQFVTGAPTGALRITLLGRQGVIRVINVAPVPTQVRTSP